MSGDPGQSSPPPGRSRRVCPAAVGGRGRSRASREFLKAEPPGGRYKDAFTSGAARGPDIGRRCAPEPSYRGRGYETFGRPHSSRMRRKSGRDDRPANEAHHPVDVLP